jgi:hypothetical protein
MDWDGNLSRNPAARRSDHQLDEGDISSCCSAAEVGANLFRVARDLPKLLEIQFFRRRRAAEFPSGRGALDEVNR